LSGLPTASAWPETQQNAGAQNQDEQPKQPFFKSTSS
jgi:hypothetical protein